MRNEPVLLRDILPKVMSDIRGRMRTQKAIKSRAIANRGARGQGRSGKIRSPGRSPSAALEGKAETVKSGIQGDRQHSERFTKRRFF